MGFEINLITLRKKFCLFCRINNFNQYTAIDTFVPQYDADGNQTLIKTSTGIWSVTYNVENRPVRWECGDTVVTMDFDRMGRRTFYKEMNGNTQVTFTRFVYKDYLCVRQLFSNSPYNTYKNFVWDPTERIATRPLKLQLPTMSLNLFYMHDGNKNVSDVVYRLTSNGVAAHYDYAPFGAVTRSVSNAVPTADITTLNPFRFSSEYHDDTLGLVYYNYRHYNPTDGRWTSRDPIEELRILNLYQMLESVNRWDLLGQDLSSPWSVNTTFARPLKSRCSILLEKFQQWFKENQDLTWTTSLKPCPKEIKCISGKFVTPDPTIWTLSVANESYHPGGTYELRMSTCSGAGNQCIYDKCGKIITSIPSAGTADFSSPREWYNPFNWDDVLGHYLDDVIPYEWAEELDVCYPNSTPTFVEQYYMRRPIIVEK